MTIEYRDAVNNDGLFDVLGKGFKAMADLATASGTTVDASVEAFLTQTALHSGSQFQEAVASVPGALRSWQASGNSLSSYMADACARLVIEYCQANKASIPDNIATALAYLVEEMEADGYYVDASTVALSLAAGAANSGDVQLLYTERRGDGQTEANALAEDLEFEVTSESAGTPTISVTGELAYDRLNQEWPGGSGVNTSFAAVSPAASLLSNGDFEDAAIAHTPDNWIIRTGTAGDTVRLTGPAIQTIAITGTPSGGSYVLLYTNAAGIKRAAPTLAYNASGADVQAALRQIPGLESVTVETTGTSPNYTHTVTFTGVGGEVAVLTSANSTRFGTITHAVLYHGHDGSYSGSSLMFRGDGTTSPAIYHALTLAEETVYFCHFWASRRTSEPETSSASSSSSSWSSGSYSVSESSASSASSQSASSNSSSSLSSTSTYSSSSLSSHSRSSNSSSSQSSSSLPAYELKVEILDGIDGGLLHDSAGNALVLDVDIDALSMTGHTSQWFSFRLPKFVADPVYLRIRTSSPLDTAESVFIDQMTIARGVQLYAGGPWVAAVSGVTAAMLEDAWTLTVANNRGGSMQEWFHRAFDMAGNGLLLPVAGTTNLPDSLIA
ncbi:MAG: hypothetical protein ABFD92_21400 [Planctomycetaceae bacterium]